MKNLLLIILCYGCLGVFPSWGETAASEIKLCVDGRFWYPFTYTEESETKGMHVDLVKKALDTLGYAYHIQPLPRKRCLHIAKHGQVDAVISIAYDEELQNSLEFPEGASRDKESRWRIMQVDHVVVTYQDDPYEFEGDPLTLPVPVRIPLGESLIVEMKKLGLRIDHALKDENNLVKLLRDKTGSVVTTSVMAEHFNQQPKLAGRFTIHPTPLTSNSYYLAFSKKTALTKEQQLALWKEIVRWRDDYVYTLQLFAQY